MKVIRVLEGLPQAEHLRMLNVYGLQSTKIGTESLRTRSCLEIQKNIVSEILMQDLGMKYVMAKLQNSFLEFFYQSRRNIVLYLLMT